MTETYIWLKFRQKGAALGVTTAMRFNALLGEDLPETGGLEQIGLKQIHYTHLLSRRSVWDVTIGADELFDPTARAFITEFWLGAQKWLCFSASETEPAAGLFTEIKTPTGRAPLAPIEGNWDLVSFATTMTAKRPD